MKLNILGTLDNKENVINQILTYHGLKEDWLTADKSFFHDGRKMRNFQEGYDLLEKHKNGKIYILQDADTDGITSVAVLYLWLQETYPAMQLNYIIPEGKTHGIINDLMPEKEECDLFIILDASSNEVEKHKEYSEIYDLLILDHHSLSQNAVSNDYAVIINPQHPHCPYPNKSLSGVGVVYKFIETIDKINNIDNHTKYLDLVASGQIADVMSLKSYENKAIANIGLNNLLNPFITAYIKADGRLKDKTKLTPIGVSFYLAPIINSVIRIGSLELKTNMFRAMIGEIAAEPVIAEMIKIKGKQDRSKEPIVTRIVLDLQRNGRDKNAVIAAIAPERLPYSMTGLVAGQLAGMYQKPTILVREQIDEETNKVNYIGSARSMNESSVENFKDFCNESELFNWALGHQPACGISLPKENLDKFLSYANNELPPFERQFNVWELGNNKSEIIEILDLLSSHYGTDFPEILLLDKVYINNNAEIVGQHKNTLRVMGKDLTYVHFRYKGDLPENSKVLQIIGKPNINEWMGLKQPQIIIEYIEEQELEL